MRVRSLYEQFKMACPKSNEQFIPTRENIRRWQNMITLQNNHSKFNRVDRKVFEKGELITSFEKLPFKTRVTVNKCIEEIKKRFPETTDISLTGSHVKGLAREDSDFDFMVLPKKVTSFEFDGIKVDLLPFTQREKIKLIGSE